jgi:PAS domain S-box-containing protein
MRLPITQYQFMNALAFQNVERAIIRNPIIVNPETPVTQVVVLMNQAQGIRSQLLVPSRETGGTTDRVETSCVLVVSEARLVGIFTEADVVKVVARRKSLKGISVAEVMTGELVTLNIREFKNLSTALNLLQQHDIRHLPILDNAGEVLGIVTQRSLLEALYLVEGEDLQKQSEEKLQQAKEQLQAVLNAVPGFVSWIGVDGIYRGVNNYLAEIFGLSADDFAGQELGFMQNSPDFVEFMRQFLAGSELAASSVIDARVKGETRNYLIAMQKYQQNTAAVVVGIDITNRKQAEIALQNLVEGAASTTGQDFFPALVKYICSALNVRYAGVTELIDGQLHSLGFWSNGQLQPDDTYDPSLTPCKILLQEGTYCCASNVQQLFPQARRLADMEAESFMGITLTDDFGEPIGTLYIVDDKPITEPDKFQGILRIFAVRATTELQRQRAQESLQKLNLQLENRVMQRTRELQESEAELRRQLAAVEAAIDGIAILRGDTFTYLNKAHVELFGYSKAEELIGKTWEELYESHEINYFKSQVFPILLQQKHWRGETTAKRKDGSRFAEEVSLTITEQGDLICVCRDISPRKQAEQLLEEQRRFLRSVIDNNPNCIFVKDPDGKFLLVNQAMADFHNTIVQELVGKTDTEYYSDAELTQLKESDKTVLTELQPIEVLEASVRKSTGEECYFQTIKLPLIAPNGELRGLLSVATDITERKLAQDALQQQIERERLINAISQRIRESLDLQEILTVTVAEIQELLHVDRALIYRILADGTGKVIAEAITLGCSSILNLSFPIESFPPDCYQRYLNGNIYALTDRRLREQPSCMIQFMEDMQVYAKLVVPIIQQGVLWGLLIVHQCSGSREWKTWEIELLQVLANQLAIATKQSSLYAQLQIELNERKQAEAELLQVKERLQFLIASSPAAIYTARPSIQSTPNYISENVFNIFGYTAEEFLNNPEFWISRIHPEDTAQVLQNLPQVFSKGYHSHEYRWKHRDGEYRWMFDQLKLVYDRDGLPLEVIGLWIDISDRKQAEVEIRKALEKEKELSELKSRFISMTSHEFRTPLAVIASSAGILKNFSHKLDEKQKQKHLQCIQTYIQHTTQLLDDILLINKAEAGKLAFNPAPLDIVDFCRSLVEELQLSAPTHRIVFSSQYLHSSLAQGGGFVACMDKKLLRQIISNLLSNSIKYSQNGTNVQLKVLINTDTVIFQIKDEGIGISQEEQQHIFESFFRASNVGNAPGTGLGLSIVQKCIELHGGEIMVFSEIGVGTTFRVELPLFVK